MNAERAADIGKLGASMLALLSCQDVGIAIKTSCNAVENNFIPAAIGIGFVAWEGYDIYCTARDEGVEAAVIKLGFDVAVAATGLYTGKRVYQLGKIIAPTAAEALLQYKQAHPLFAKCYDQAASVIGKGVEKYKVLDAKLDAKARQLLGSKNRLTKVSTRVSNLDSQSTLSALDLAETKPILAYDYSATEAAYTLRIDPLTGKGPMAVDSNLFTSATSHTVNGAKRNKDQFWKMWQQKYPETLSQENVMRITCKTSPLAPKVDKTWIKHFPEHQRYKDEILVHHHIDHSELVTALPESVHNRNPGRTLFHSNLGGKKKYD